MKKVFSTLTLLVGLLMVISSCKKHSDVPDCDLPLSRATKVTIKANQVYLHDLGNFGDEEGASISEQGTHFSVSTLERDTNTDKVIYKYIPDTNFVGIDAVTIKSERGSNGASPNSNITYTTIQFMITN